MHTKSYHTPSPLCTANPILIVLRAPTGDKLQYPFVESIHCLLFADQLAGFQEGEIVETKSCGGPGTKEPSPKTARLI